MHRAMPQYSYLAQLFVVSSTQLFKGNWKDALTVTYLISFQTLKSTISPQTWKVVFSHSFRFGDLPVTSRTQLDRFGK